ncbi:MAG: hypothetical protein H8E12_16840 [Rhodobacteraceae bacterium]|nr:hypothetical protein [Paracoccaceae bacterium]
MGYVDKGVRFVADVLLAKQAARSDVVLTLIVEPLDVSSKYYSKGYKYLKFSKSEALFKYAVFMHKNSKGTHFDIRLASLNNPNTVFSWAAKKNPLDRDYPVPMHRTKDHPESALSPDTEYMNKSGEPNRYTSLAEGSAVLTEIDKSAGLLFEAHDRAFRIIPQRGKRYLYHEVD